MYTVEAEPGAVKADGSRYTPQDLRTLHDWVVRPQLRTVPGVTEVNSVGGYRKQYVVAPVPTRLAGFGLTVEDVIERSAERRVGKEWVSTGRYRWSPYR